MTINIYKMGLVLKQYSIFAFIYFTVSSSDNVAKLKWSESSDSPYKTIFPSINIVRDSEPLQFYLRKPAFDFVTEDFTTGK